MARWKCAALALVCGAAMPAAAQDGVDWGGIMQTDAMNSAVEEAAREGSGSGSGAAQVAPPRPRIAARSEKTRANCAKARGWAAEGVRDARLPRLLSLCKQAGY